MNTIWHFIKTHLRQKTIVFLSTCKQVQFISKAFSKLQPGIVLRSLSGRMGQKARNTAYNDFQSRKEVIMFCTDIAARGLDFDGVDWVLQADCPENPQEYIHRVGRTARFNADGKALLLLLPSEVKIIDQLQAHKIPILQKQIDYKAIEERPVTPSLVALLTKHGDLREAAEAVVRHYVKATALQPNKEVFQIDQVNIQEFAQSLGLQSVPKITWTSKIKANIEFAKDYDVRLEKNDIDEENGNKDESEDEILEIIHNQSKNGNENGVSNADNDQDKPNGADVDIPPRKKRKKLKIEAGKAYGKKVVFNEEGESKKPFELFAANESESSPKLDLAMIDAKSRFEELKDQIRQQDAEDKQEYKNKRRQAKIQKLLKLQRQEMGDMEEDEGRGVTLGNYDEEENGSGGSENGESEDQLGEGNEEVAHYGMGLKSQEIGGKQFILKSRKVPSVGDASLEDYETLALKLLNQ
eukprot:TRINITY_DN32381_c1_g1_i1.p1 TRINITY_DN32381_c1_g1~~TRINITY_DN32381_c1_g1_i1.p1  ORF type:complete len:468 (-),score=91.75 TRINITY_DN32381_c1_g1_i1:91-1494(-)